MSRGALLGAVLLSGCLRPNPAYDDDGAAAGSGSAGESTATGGVTLTGAPTGDASGATAEPSTGSAGASATATASTTDGCDNCTCLPEQVEDCYGGPAGTEGVGPCKAGMRTCEASGVWGPCQGEVTPTADACGNGVDEDCDGAADDEPACALDPECPALAGLVACYPFPPEFVDELRDGSGHGHHGALSGVTLVDGLAGHGKAGKFADGSVAGVPEHAELSPDHFTVALLARPAGLSAMAVVDKDNQFGLFFNAGVLECIVINDAAQIKSATVMVPAGTWSLVACSFDGVHVTVRQYSGGANAVAVDLNGALNPSGSGMRIGDNSPQGGLPFAGELDGVLLFDRALSGDELCALAGPLCA